MEKLQHQGVVDAAIRGKGGGSPDDEGAVAETCGRLDLRVIGEDHRQWLAGEADVMRLGVQCRGCKQQKQ